MKVLLTKDVPKLGRTGSIVEVSDGHARNFLFPKHLALPATSSVLAQIQKEETEHQGKVKRDHERFLDLKKKLEQKNFTIKAKAQKNNLFAAISPAAIAKTINDKAGLEINPKLIQIKNPIKSLGEHEVLIQFAKDQGILVKLNVEKE